MPHGAFRRRIRRIRRIRRYSESMTSKRDDDALSWAGDDDPTLAAGQAPAEPELPEGWTVPAGSGPIASGPIASGTASSPPGATNGAPAASNGAREGEAETPSAAGSVALVGMGVLAGIYLLYTVGWFIAASRINDPVADPVAQFMFSLGAWIAVAAPVIWFGASFWLVSHPRHRFLWLLAGVVLLAPLPFIAGGRVS
jgi:hypothetical protein